MAPFEAALKGSREIGFTIISITVSLVAVFMPVLLMGGVIGQHLQRVRHRGDRLDRRPRPSYR